MLQINGYKNEIEEVKIEITAPTMFNLVLVGCSSCEENLYVDEKEFTKLTSCPFCLAEGALYGTYSLIGVPTLEEIEELDVTLMINGVKRNNIKAVG
ncbi:hypothetical protein AM501_24040 [Aneurinibacillus migulanus]|uniref:hypothetical protein n=1 Tax=Aneurinibacillus migulanus TaxID=47500 RepID=UPI0005BAC470|nr:hypothetical protein [Aneurinibacillus migulanus]KIV58920.1 hypothetical protein TS64_03940 [Aneurinibacillus migulanus]KPD05848.1 hypothetical protein AM501_24040 [Aneurinibacillus migulanus]